MNTKISYVELLARNPELFWMVVYVAWGGVYAALTISLAVLVSLQRRWDKRKDLSRVARFAMQMTWGLSHVGAAIAVPLLMAALAPDVLRQADYFWLFAGTWGIATAAAYGLARPFWKELLKSD